jgi:cytochrome c553
MVRVIYGVLWWSLAIVAVSSARSAAAAEPGRAQIEFFEKKVRPVLVEHCYSCHSATAKKVRGGLLLDTRAALRAGGDSGAAVVPGKPHDSLLLKAIRYEEHEMPPAGKLPAAMIADIERWVRDGAADPRDAPADVKTSKRADVAAAKQAWAFQQPRPQSTPPVRNTAWPRTKIDSFILARLELATLAPAPPADRRTWIRRVTFDLTGLPPTPAEVEAFIGDTTAAAEARVVDRLLTSPHFGERWARLWLDIARFAEDQAHIVGSDRSLFYPNAYLYRDWVIKSLNDDMPYDRFVKLQLAADLIDPKDTTDLPALGFLGLGPKYFGRKSPAVIADEWEDRIDVVGRGLLGLTVACARCHDHKFDPIPTDDYYALAGVFAGTKMFNRPLDAAKTAEASNPKDALHVVAEGKPTDVTVAIRGDLENKGPIAPRHFLRVLCAAEPSRFHDGSGRRELADAIADPLNPLTARVIVNRVWAQFFGRGIVGTPSNFGALGEPPTHPELLDDLAVRFVESGWSLKWLMREITLSATYSQGSDARPQTTDPENRLLSRMNRRRLSVESWRDSLLATAGQLDLAVGGKSIDPQDPKENRRTVYSAVSRLELNRMLALFDFPDPNATADHRAETTTPLQKMFVLNSPFVVAQAAALAERLATESDAGARIDRAYRLLYGRPPTDAEVRLGLAFIGGGDGTTRWQQYAHMLLAANEMLFID